jgi:hypothetical protein
VGGVGAGHGGPSFPWLGVAAPRPNMTTCCHGP